MTSSHTISLLFKESRHAFGMRALGLPNTKHFHEITRIEDALARACYCARSLSLTTRSDCSRTTCSRGKAQEGGASRNIRAGDDGGA